MTTFSDGTQLAALRWTGPAIPLKAPRPGLGRVGDRVVVVTDGELISIGDPFSTWPVTPGDPEQHFVGYVDSQYATRKVFALPDGDLFCGVRPMRWRPGRDESVTDPLWVDAYEVTPDGGL